LPADGYGILQSVLAKLLLKLTDSACHTCETRPERWFDKLTTLSLSKGVEGAGIQLAPPSRGEVWRVSGFPLPDQVEDKPPGPLAGFRGNDKLWYVPIKTTLIRVFALKTGSLSKKNTMI
jgi:hypothetical protein